LGATQSEIQKSMPGPAEIDAALKRRLAAASAARKQQNEAVIDERQSRKKLHSGETFSQQDEDLDLRDAKKLKVYFFYILFF
jgi:predicted phosphohydrolase